MATTTILAGATCTIAGGTLGGAVDVSDQLQSIVLTQAVDELEKTSLADSARFYVAGLQTNEVTLSLYNSFGAGEIEATLAGVIGKSDIVLVFTGTTSATESASNPEYTLTNCFLASTTPINSQYGELSMVEVTFRGGVLTRDIT
jgi:hypothetical protein